MVEISNVRQFSILPPRRGLIGTRRQRIWENLIIVVITAVVPRPPPPTAPGCSAAQGRKLGCSGAAEAGMFR